MCAAAFRTARSAWEHLVQQGGLEIAARDRPLVEMLKHRLNPHATTIEDALDGVRIEGFLNAFFGTITPFVAMMRDLLDYFESAEAKEGPEQWTLALGDGADRLEVNLDHFRQWIERGTTTSHERRQVPILDGWLKPAFRDMTLRPRWRQPEQEIRASAGPWRSYWSGSRAFSC